MDTEPIITQDKPQPFIVRVKLLTNQVHDFQVNKQMKVAQFKALICPKVNVPIERMRIVFAGKQLLDDKPLSQYVSESGMTVHLIARTAPPSQTQPTQTNSSQNTPLTQNIPNQTSQPTAQQIPPNPFGDIMGMVNSLFGGANGQQTGNVPPQITMAFGNLGGGGLNANNPLGGLLGGLGMRIQTTNSPPQPQSPLTPQTQQPAQRQPQQQQPVPSQSTQQQQQQQNPSNRIQYSQISQLNQTLNNLNIPLDNVTTQNEILNPEGVIKYLRRLHHQSSRSLLQLNRLLNMAQNNNHNTENLQNFIPVFQAMNSANNVAINSLTQLLNQRISNNNNNPLNIPTSNIQQQNQPVPQVSLISMNMTISDQNGNSIQPINFQAQRPQQQTTQTQQLPQQSQQQPQSQQQQRLQSSTTQQPQMQMPINPMQILGGLDLGSILGGLNSVGGVNGLFGLTLRQMMSEGNQQPSGIFLQLFGGMTGQNMMQMFTTKDFRFLKDKHPQVRQILKKKISQKGEQNVITNITKQITKLLVPSQPHPKIENLSLCRQKCIKIIKNNVRELVKVSLSQNQPQYDIKAVEIGKKLLCENIKTIVHFTINHIQSVAFEIIKYQTLNIIEPILPGIAGMFYGLVERDLFRIYNQFKAEEQRKKKMTVEDSQSEQQLIDIIKEVGSQNSQILSKIQHSASYFQAEQL